LVNDAMLAEEDERDMLPRDLLPSSPITEPSTDPSKELATETDLSRRRLRGFIFSSAISFISSNA